MREIDLSSASSMPPAAGSVQLPSLHHVEEWGLCVATAIVHVMLALKRMVNLMISSAWSPLHPRRHSVYRLRCSDKSLIRSLSIRRLPGFARLRWVQGIEFIVCSADIKRAKGERHDDFCFYHCKLETYFMSASCR